MSRIDYDRMSAVHPKQEAALRRAVKTGDPDRVREVCRQAVKEWNQIGCWPDDWNRWNMALNDLLPWYAPEELDDL